MIDDRGATVYRDRRKGWVYVAAGVYGCLMLGALLVLARPGLLDAAQIVVGLVLSLWSIFRLSRCGVHAGDDGIRVVNPLSTPRLRWDEIRRFVLAERGPSSIELVDGSTLKVFGIQHCTWAALRRSTRTREAAIIDELNARLRARTGR